MSPSTVAVLRCGDGADAFLRHVSGHVAAVFQSSLYIEAAGDFLCLGPEVIGNGPLNAIVADDAFRLLKANVGDGESFTVRGGKIHLAGVSLDLAAAARWRPRPLALPSLGWTSGTLASAVRTLAPLLPEEGLSRAVILGREADKASPTARVALPAIAALRSLLRQSEAAFASGDLTSAAGLLGLGPGLTPSGDDVIGGALIALHGAGRKLMADALWSGLEPHAAARTSPLGHAHLRAAATGQGAEVLHLAMADLLAGSYERLAASAPNLGKVGHTSGFDGIAGGILAFESWIAPRAS